MSECIISVFVGDVSSEFLATQHSVLCTSFNPNQPFLARMILGSKTGGIGKVKVMSRNWKLSYFIWNMYLGFSKQLY